MEKDKLKKWYSEELKRKDKVIEELREQNEILIKSALKSSKRIDELTQKLKKATKTK